MTKEQKQIAVFSGKGGTGKTSFTAAIAALSEDAVFADCDVDAANLHLILKPDIRDKYIFRGGKTARIEDADCTGCGACIPECRFGAMQVPDADTRAVPAIDLFACEGCNVCVRICPVGAISLEQKDAGFLYIADTEYGPFVYAELQPGEDNSGKLITEVRKSAQAIADKEKKSLCIIDGPPGTGCAVMASLTGADLALIVTEPTVSGIHDMNRAVEVAGHFSIPTAVVVNKATVNVEHTERIRAECEKTGIPFLGTIPFSLNMVDAVSSLVPYVQFADDEVSDSIKKIWQRILKLLETTG